MLGDERAHDAKQAAPEAGEAAGGAAHGGGERLGRPAVQHGVEHALEEVLHREHAQVLGDRVDDAEEQDRRAHQPRRDGHGPLAPERRQPVHERPQQHAQRTRRVCEDVGCVCEGERVLLRRGAVLYGQDTWEVEAYRPVSIRGEREYG